MATFIVKEQAHIVYELTTWQGIVEVDGELIKYRISEDNNGVTMWIFNGSDWIEYDSNNDSDPNKQAVLDACLEYGDPEEFGPIGDTFEFPEEF